MAVRIITPPAAEPITLQEAKAHLRVVFDDDDGQITGFIMAARGMVEKLTQRHLMPQVVEFAVGGWGYGIRAQAAPFRQLVNITYTDVAGATQTLEPAGAFVDTFLEPALIGLPYGGVWPDAQPDSLRIVRAEVGYPDAASVPPALKQWMLLAIGAMYEHRATAVAGVSIAQLPEDFMHGLWHPYRVYF